MLDGKKFVKALAVSIAPERCKEITKKATEKMLKNNNKQLTNCFSTYYTHYLLTPSMNDYFCLFM